MGLFGIGDTNRILVDIPVRYAPILGLPYDPDDESVFEKTGKKINIKVPKRKKDQSEGQAKAAAELHAVQELMKYGIPAQAAKSLVGKDYELLTDSKDSRYKEWQLEASSPEDVAAGRGRLRVPTGLDVATGAEYGDVAPVARHFDKFYGTYDDPLTPFEDQAITGEQVAEIAADPFDVNVAAGESKSIADALAAMEKEQARQASARAQAEAERKAREDYPELMPKGVSAEDAQAAMKAAQVKKDVEVRAAAAREAELRARAEEVRLDPEFAAEEGLGGERSIDPITGEVRDTDIGQDQRAQTLEQALETQRGDWESALAELRAERQPIVNDRPNFGDYTPFDVEEGSTSIQEMLNIFMQNPERYYTTEDIFDDDGNVISTRQALNPSAKAALQAFSTQRGAEAMETGAKFGTGGPFGAIAGLGGTAQQAIDLAEQQAYSGITSPFAALQTGGELGDISQILRGGVTAQEQSDLAGLQARGGLSATEQRQLAGLQARGGLGVADQFALAGMQARGGLTPEQMRGLAGLQARGGLTAQQRYAEQRLGMMPSLLQMSPQSLGGFAEIFGGGEIGKKALQGYLSPFFKQPDFAAQGTAPGIDWTAEGALTPQALPPGTQPEPYIDPTENIPRGDTAIPWGEPREQPVSQLGRQYISTDQLGMPMYVSNTGRAMESPLAFRDMRYIERPIGVQPSPQDRPASRGLNTYLRPTSVQAPATRQTLGGYGKATPFARGGTQARAAIAGKELEDYLGEVTPFGGETRRGGLGARRTRQFTL